MDTPLGRFRYIALAEGLSFIILLAIAMPLKYFAHIPIAVSIVGAIHGLLFVLYLMALVHVIFVHRWSIFRILGALLASIIPFGTFVFDAQLRKKH